MWWDHAEIAEEHRAVLDQHREGRLPIDVSDTARMRRLNTLASRDLLRLIGRGRPHASVLTRAGRRAMLKTMGTAHKPDARSA